MRDYQLPVGLFIAVGGPLIALYYLRSILVQVIDLLCPAPGSSEFWWRTLVVLALAGSVLLMLMFGPRGDALGLADFLRHSLLLMTLSVFVSVAFVASRIWRQITKWLQDASPEKAKLHGWNQAVQS
jgi:hypothetical protein